MASPEDRANFFYSPKSLRGMFGDGKTEKRLRNREGWAVGIDVAQGNTRWQLAWISLGGVREIHDRALEDAQKHPERRFLVVEDVCNGSETEVERILAKMIRGYGLI